MEVFSVGTQQNSDPLRANLGRLIESVGTPRFEDDVFSVAQDAFHCDHISAVCVTEASAPRILMSATNGTASIPRDIAETYVRRYWDLDPANHAPSDLPPSESFGLRIVPGEDIADEEYRHACYTAYHLVERISVVRRCGTDLYRLNFYAGEARGRFSQDDVTRMTVSADVLLALLVKHDASAAKMPEERAAASFGNRLKLIAPKMPQREAEVCTAIMLGMTSEAIAAKLGISINTVLTYRKRAYSRLNITCQNELLRLVLC